MSLDQDLAGATASYPAYIAKPAVDAALAKRQRNERAAAAAISAEKEFEPEALTPVERDLLDTLDSLQRRMLQLQTAVESAKQTAVGRVEMEAAIQQNQRKILHNDATWLSKTGKVDDGAKACHAREARHFAVHQAAAQAMGTKEIRQVETREELLRRLDDAEAEAGKGMDLADQHAKVIMIAHAQGWAVAREWEGDTSLGLTDEEMTRLRKAKRACSEGSTKRQEGGRRPPKGDYRPRPAQPFRQSQISPYPPQFAAQRAGQRVCYACGEAGHFASACKNAKPR
jgi:hypothetical protein